MDDPLDCDWEDSEGEVAYEPTPSMLRRITTEDEEQDEGDCDE